jgi:hypothetical protein
MKNLHAFLITPMHATIPAHLTRTSARHAMTTEDLKLGNPGVLGYDAVSLGDVETSGTTHLTA